MSRYLEESEGKTVGYRNKKHREVFEEITAKMDKKNYALLSVLYLLTADHRLWKFMKLKMAKGKKEPMEIKRCVVFFRMVWILFK